MRLAISQKDKDFGCVIGRRSILPLAFPKIFILRSIRIVNLLHPQSLQVFAPVAQGIEQWIPNPCAACSNHAGGTNIFLISHFSLILFCAVISKKSQ